MIELAPSRIRPLTLLAAVLVAQVLLLAFQIRRAGTDVRLIREWTVFVVTPFQQFGTYVYDGVRGTWSSYVDLRTARQENEQLRGELGQLRLRNHQLEGQAAEAKRLAALISFRDAHPEAEMVIARVIGASAAGATKTIFINRGQGDGIAKNMGVITPEGVVGKVLEVYANTSQILLLTDKDSGIGVLLAGDRTQGVVRGANPAEGETEPHMHYVVSDKEVAVGEKILTSGQDRIYQKDLPVATVVEAKTGNPFKIIRVRPAARLDRLEEVIVLKTRMELAVPEASIAEGGAGKEPAPAKQP